jgi:pilus assembly protein CpaF
LAARAPTLRLAVELGSPVVTEAVLGAIADGADGVIALRCASSLGRGLLRLRADLGGYTEGAARALLAGTFEVVVEVARLRDDRHRVLRVAEIADASENSLELADVFTFVMDRTAAGGMIEGSFVPAATMPAITDMLRSRGATLDSSLFSRPPSR